jgi:hypothetical protein
MNALCTKMDENENSEIVKQRYRPEPILHVKSIYKKMLLAHLNRHVALQTLVMKNA